MITTGTKFPTSTLKQSTAFFAKDVSAAVEIMKYRQRMDKLEVEIASKAFTGHRKARS